MKGKQIQKAKDCCLKLGINYMREVGVFKFFNWIQLNWTIPNYFQEIAVPTINIPPIAISPQFVPPVYVPPFSVIVPGRFDYYLQLKYRK